jgi:cysteine desulfurase
VTDRAYLDHAASTPMLPEAVSALAEQLATTGNASSLHTSGRRARRVVEESREQLAAVLGARPGDVVLTAGGTEADNLAVVGGFRARRAQDPRRVRLLVSAVEHHAVLDPARWLAEHEGAELVELPVDAVGRLDVDALRREVERDPAAVALVSVMWANNEIGTVQPLDQVVAIAHAHDVPVHTDAVQAVGQVPVDFAASGVDLLSLSAHKLGGPLGVGALVAVRGAQLEPLLHGGGQERALRSGTLDAPGVRSMAVAAGLAHERMADTSARVRALRERLVQGVRDLVPDVVVNGDPDPAGRLPGIAGLAFPGCDGDSLLYLLDAQGVECSTGSACQAGVPQPSHVLLATGLAPDVVGGALRLSLGHSSTEADVDAVLAALPGAVQRSRRAVAAGRQAG